VAAATQVVVSIRPEAVTLSEAGGAARSLNEWSGEVLTRAFLGDSVDHIIGVGKHEIRNRANPSISIEPGTKVCVHLDPAKLTLIPMER
jgi:iron(III) transport system ATP-binding protein